MFPQQLFFLRKTNSIFKIMNLLKSIFISSFMMFCLASAVFAVWMLGQGGNFIGWTGVMLTSLPFMSVISWLMIAKSKARTSSRFPIINVLGAIGIGLAVFAFIRQEVNFFAPLLATIGWLGFLLYAFWYSSLQRKPSESLKIGNRLPKFELKNVKGSIVSSTDLSDKPTILMFYRGNWCPLCMAQIKELASRYRELEDLGARIALVSPQPHTNTVELAKKFDVNFEFLTDEGNKAARILGIESENGIPMGMQMLGYESETVLPTVIITDKDGIVVWTHETDNYRVRPEPDVFLEVFQKHQIASAGN